MNFNLPDHSVIDYYVLVFAIKLCDVLCKSQSTNEVFDKERHRKLYGFRSVFQKRLDKFYLNVEDIFIHKNGEILRQIVYFLALNENFTAILLTGETDKKKQVKKKKKGLKQRKNSQQTIEARKKTNVSFGTYETNQTDRGQTREDNKENGICYF